MMQSFNQRVCRMEETRVCKNTICSHDMNRGGAGGGGGMIATNILEVYLRTLKGAIWAQLGADAWRGEQSK